ncbi:MAG: hypothetical protein EON52_00005 [Actinomycetales bacterium]|nr:MAG: hypothetical protein EON52_00005 [Actinomycetales bacterium]
MSPNEVSDQADGTSSVRYRFKDVTAVKGMESRTIAKWEKAGWEFVERHPGAMLRSQLRFRRARPTWFAGLDSNERATVLTLAVLLVIGVVAVGGAAVFGGSGGGDESRASPETNTTPTMTAPASPEAPPSASIAPAAPEEVVSFVEGFVEERVAADVAIARAVSAVEVDGRTLRVTFDSARTGLSREQFDSINPFNNPNDETESLADFIGAPMMNSSEEATAVRGALDDIVTDYVDGSQDGRRTIEQLEDLNGL